MDTKAVELLVTTALAGGFGGFVDGLITRTDYTLRLPYLKRKAGSPQESPWWAEIDFGTLGDILVGAAAGVAIFVVAGGLLSIDIKVLSTDPNAYLRVIALGVLAGFSGLKLLAGLSRQTVEALSKQTAIETVKQEMQKSSDVAVFIKEADAALDEFDSDYKKLTQHTGSEQAEVEKLLEKAIAKYDAALGADPANEQALRGKARALRRKATASADRGQTAEAATFWNQAIGLLSSILERNSQSALSYYNRACYRRLAGKSDDDALSDLANAISLSPSLKQYAQHDPDLAALSTNQRFKELTA